MEKYIVLNEKREEKKTLTISQVANNGGDQAQEIHTNRARRK